MFGPWCLRLVVMSLMCSWASGGFQIELHFPMFLSAASLSLYIYIYTYSFSSFPVVVFIAIWLCAAANWKPERSFSFLRSKPIAHGLKCHMSDIQWTKIAYIIHIANTIKTLGVVFQ